MKVRVGIPASFQKFSAVAVDLDAPVLISANALYRKGGSFRLPSPDLFNGADAALDSAGFVAMARYWGYRWYLDQYVGLAGSFPWAWWAAPDYCCEPEIAHDRQTVIERVTATAAKLSWAQAVAEDKGVKPPMPVLQGWRPDDYIRCADLIGDLPPLVGIGSVCRRGTAGADGLFAIVEVLDRELPKHVRFHMFGVKGDALPMLATYTDRIASTDSMAWDFAARRRVDRAAGETFNLEHRARHMRAWYRTQRRRLDPVLYMFS